MAGGALAALVVGCWDRREPTWLRRCAHFGGLSRDLVVSSKGEIPKSRLNRSECRQVQKYCQHMAETPAPKLGAWGERSQRRNRLLPLWVAGFLREREQPIQK
jgi:hypothetical protein